VRKGKPIPRRIGQPQTNCTAGSFVLEREICISQIHALYHPTYLTLSPTQISEMHLKNICAHINQDLFGCLFVCFSKNKFSIFHCLSRVCLPAPARFVSISMCICIYDGAAFAVVLPTWFSPIFPILPACPYRSLLLGFAFAKPGPNYPNYQLKHTGHTSSRGWFSSYLCGIFLENSR